LYRGRVGRMCCGSVNLMAGIGMWYNTDEIRRICLLRASERNAWVSRFASTTAVSFSRACAFEDPEIARRALPVLLNLLDSCPDSFYRGNYAWILGWAALTVSRNDVGFRTHLSDLFSSSQTRPKSSLTHSRRILGGCLVFFPSL